jgi:hypothetical protein
MSKLKFTREEIDRISFFNPKDDSAQNESRLAFIIIILATGALILFILT